MVYITYAQKGDFLERETRSFELIDTDRLIDVLGILI